MATKPTPRPDRSSAPTSSPRPQKRDPVKAQQFIDSRDDNDNNSAAVQQGIAAIAAASGGDGGKRVFSQTPMTGPTIFNAAGQVVGTYDGRPERPSLPMTPAISIDEVFGLGGLSPQDMPPRGLPLESQTMFGRNVSGSMYGANLPDTAEFMYTAEFGAGGMEGIEPEGTTFNGIIPGKEFPMFLGEISYPPELYQPVGGPPQAVTTSSPLANPYEPSFDPVVTPNPLNPYILGGGRTRYTTQPTGDTKPFVDTTTPAGSTQVSVPVQGMFAPPSLPGMPVPEGGRFPVTTIPRTEGRPTLALPTVLDPQERDAVPTANTAMDTSISAMFAPPRQPGMPTMQSAPSLPGMMDQPPSRSPLLALRPNEVGTAPTVDTRSAPFPVAAPVPAPQPAITPEAIAGDISQSAASADRPSFNPLDFTMVGMAKRLIDSLAGGGGGGSLGSTRPETRPSVMNVMRGEGDDAQMYMAATRDMPRFGISAGDEMLPPDYSPFSLRGLTSSDPANVMRNIQGSERMARAFPDNSGSEDAAPVAPTESPVDTEATPTDDRPSWWPPYLPWPPEPQSAAPMPTYRPPPVAPVTTGQQYSTSYSGLQGAISGAGNPLMMGIGGMIRRS